MMNLKKLILVVLLSNVMIFAEDDLNFPNGNRLTNHAASSAFLSQQFPVLFVDISFTYGQPIVGIFYFMYTVVAESFYARMMSFNFAVRPANIKRTDGNLHLPDLDTNVLTLTLPEDCSRQSTLSPCFYIGSPPLPPFSSPQRSGVRKRAPSNPYMTKVDLF